MHILVGIGCDIEKTQRFKGVIKNREFLSNIFTDAELQYCLKQKSPEAYLACHFVCKEAVFKALSSMGERIPLKFIEILTKGRGKRSVRISTKGMPRAYRIFVETVITGDLAIACSVAEKNRK
ncbi:MAG: 4'-phosphopantetheinyl transferase superfamily protein [Candidatus Omnitrophica bacterium]|nr:4'-phosphopantetheinyl transferase superfamily protein [Candidatus Omnitrophota bacterium]